MQVSQLMGDAVLVDASVNDVFVDGVSVVNNKIATISLANKQNLLTAGSNVSISDNIISATDTIYNDTAISNRVTAIETQEAYWNSKQQGLTPNGTISLNADGDIGVRYGSGLSVDSEGKLISTGGGGGGDSIFWVTLWKEEDSEGMEVYKADKTSHEITDAYYDGKLVLLNDSSFEGWNAPNNIVMLSSVNDPSYSGVNDVAAGIMLFFNDGYHRAKYECSEIIEEGEYVGDYWEYILDGAVNYYPNDPSGGYTDLQDGLVVKENYDNDYYFGVKHPVPTPPTTGNHVLKCVNGVMSWVSE